MKRRISVVVERFVVIVVATVVIVIHVVVATVVIVVIFVAVVVVVVVFVVVSDQVHVPTENEMSTGCCQGKRLRCWLISNNISLNVDEIQEK